MAETTGIAWTDSTFNPWLAGTLLLQSSSPACQLCGVLSDRLHVVGVRP